jgi:hypothetical protein
MAPKESPPRRTESPESQRARRSAPASASASGSQGSPRSSPPRQAPAGSPASRTLPPRGSATGTAPPSWRPPRNIPLRNIPLSEVTPPLPARGQYAALYLTVSESPDDADGGSDDRRRSALVLRLDPSVSQFASYQCLNLGGYEWAYKVRVSSDDPPMRDSSLLLMEFVAWIPRAEVSRLSEILSSMPYPKRGDPDWNSQKWVRNAIGKLMREGLLTDQEGGQAYLKQRLAANSIAFTGFYPNRPQH